MRKLRLRKFKIFKSVFVIFLLLAQNTQHPQLEGREDYLGSLFLEVSIYGQLAARQKWCGRGAQWRTAAQVMMGRMQRKRIGKGDGPF